MRFLTKVRAMHKDVSGWAADALKDEPRENQQKVLQDFVDEHGIDGEDAKDLLYDLKKAGFGNLVKPNPSKKNAGKKMLDTATIKTAKVVESEDGIRFYKMPDGSWVDNLDPDSRDMSYPNDQEILSTISNGWMDFKVVQ